MKRDLADVLHAAKPGAAGCFNTLNIDMALSVLDAAENLSRGVIVGIASRHFDDMRAGLRASAYLRAIEAAAVPAALHLDHATPEQFDMIREALDLGFTSIMIDGSHLPFDENVEITARVVELARRYGAGVEGELGAVAGEEGVADTGHDAPAALPYTDAAEARRFVEQTGVDALAIAVGTAHGLYRESPHISLDTIEAAANAVSIPLVMHGATGVGDIAIRGAVSRGIRKINFFSGLLQAGMDEVRACADATHNDYQAFLRACRASWQELVTTQILLYAGDTH
ncbi:class II fructose-bisphosphate aldolase [Acidihalobacter prosperus]|uniref:Fructose-bisphosphate aldolase class II n=1 Tax=Acidihalobacter prosperus TaxID=160660 RepID=A0A1A6C8V3_9GAMM|nr:class II fructose-bisphosphate aldolase [Acidihalobacter prosperus]OBS10986.1 Fructose-bisphosphate aldolase class II [Acidihalobacter prosperus]